MISSLLLKANKLIKLQNVFYDAGNASKWFLCYGGFS